jgi:hypothetical protein
MRSTPGLKLLTLSLILSTGLFAQSDADKIDIRVGGSFAKPKIMPSLTKLAIAQLSVNYKLTTTESVIGKERSSGSIAGAKLTAFLETTDGELTQSDFQEITDYGYSYFIKQLQANGIQTVDWSTISNHEFYKDNADKPEDKKERGGNVWMMSNANSGNSIYSGSTAFAFGKAKKATAFSEDLGAPVAYFNLVVDFADILLNVDIKTSGGRGYNLTGYPITKTKQFKYEGSATAVMNVTPSGAGTMSLLWNEKSQAEALLVSSPMFSSHKYDTNISEDETKLKKKPFAFAKEMKPIVIETTKAQYKEAAKKALEKFADAFIAKVKAMKK